MGRSYRILKPEEISLIGHLPPFNSGPALPDPENSRVVVAEDDGEIVAYWMACVTCHVEPIYIDPKHRDGGFVAGRMLSMLLQELRDNGIEHAYVFGERPEIKNYLERLGMRKVTDAEVYVMEV